MRYQKETHKEKEPNLFESNTSPINKKIAIPEASIYDEQPSALQNQHPFIQPKTLTVFGYSPSNLDCVLHRFKEFGEIKEISYGKNWMDIKYEKENCIYRALQESETILNGEMIGVIQKNRKGIGALQNYTKAQAFAKKEDGLIIKIFTYLFG
ncbi:hypothetical protein NEOKW01_1259 [Nematocida sp. AWRm80]|nr:hypothetical protein NEOKW01_1259 [Nematocida sp. AWRm80]